MNIPSAPVEGSKRASNRGRHGRPEALIPFNALIAYADIPAARRAMDEIRDVLAATRRNYELHPMLWRFDQIAVQNWSEVALRDASQASIIVLASTESGSVPPPLERWLAKVLLRRQGSTTTIIAVLGTSEAWTISIEKPLPCPAIGKSSSERATVTESTERSAACAA